MVKPIGTHMLIEFYGCNSEVLNDIGIISSALKEAAIATGASICGSCFHEFNLQGITGALILSESHISIHTWPEYQYAAIDIFTCGETVDPIFGYLSIKNRLLPQKTYVRVMDRGLVNMGLSLNGQST